MSMIFAPPEVVYKPLGKPCVGNQHRGGKLKVAVQTESIIPQDFNRVHNDADTFENHNFSSLHFIPPSIVSWPFPLSESEVLVDPL